VQERLFTRAASTKKKSAGNNYSPDDHWIHQRNGLEDPSVNQWILGCESFTATGENGAAACNRNRSARQLNRPVKRKDRDQSTGIESLTSANNRTTLTRPFSDPAGPGLFAKLKIVF
jgi:hypothetical protein